MRGDPRMRDERRAAPPRGARRVVGERPQIVEAFARRDRDGIDPAFAKRLGESRRAAFGLRAAIARDVVDVRSARAQRVAQMLAAAVAAKDQRRACRATSESSGSASRPSLSKVVAGMRAPAMPTAASASAVPGPGASATSRAGHAPDRARHTRRHWRKRRSRQSYVRQRGVRARQRRRVGGRQDHDRRKDDRNASQRGDLLREAARLPRGPRDRMPDAPSGPAGSAGGVKAMERSCSATSRAAPRARNSVRERAAERVGRLRVVAAARRSPRMTSAPSRLASSPRSHSSSWTKTRVRGERRVAASRQRARECALGGRRERRVAVGERRERRDDIGAIGAAFERQRALPDRGQALVRIEIGGDPAGEARGASAPPRRG